MPININHYRRRVLSFAVVMIRVVGVAVAAALYSFMVMENTVSMLGHLRF